MEWLLSLLEPLLESPRAASAVRASVVVVIGLVLARIIAGGVARLTGARMSPQHALLLRRLLQYGVVAVAFAMALAELGFDLSVLLGAAGILTVALGFASQTSASNIISGLFLIGERHFEIGDAIQVGATEGVVVSIDLMSVKLRTFDNLSVRLPNETLLKSEIVNLARYPIRRLNVEEGVAYRSDLERVRAVLAEVADADPNALDEPRPTFNFYAFGDSALQIRYSVWTAQPNYIEFRTRFREAVKVAFDRSGIEVPFPQRVISAGHGPAMQAAATVASAAAGGVKPPAPVDDDDGHADTDERGP